VEKKILQNTKMVSVWQILSWIWEFLNAYAAYLYHRPLVPSTPASYFVNDLMANLRLQEYESFTAYTGIEYFVFVAFGSLHFFTKQPNNATQQLLQLQSLINGDMTDKSRFWQQCVKHGLWEVKIIPYTQVEQLLLDGRAYNCPDAKEFPVVRDYLLRKAKTHKSYKLFFGL